MNPFLHITVAQPFTGPGAVLSQSSSSPLVSLPVHPSHSVPVARVRRPPSVSRLSRALGAASLAALTWAGTAGAVDLNTATLDQLRDIRGIGPKTAQIILDERSRGGRYVSFADLSDRVRGIGPRRAQALQSAGLSIDGGGTRLSGQGVQAQQAASPVTTDKSKR